MQQLQPNFQSIEFQGWYTSTDVKNERLVTLCLEEEHGLVVRGLGKDKREIKPPHKTLQTCTAQGREKNNEYLNILGTQLKSKAKRVDCPQQFTQRETTKMLDKTQHYT